MNTTIELSGTQTIELLGYQITEEIYSGNRTLVYRGIKESDQQPVVIKLLRSDFYSLGVKLYELLTGELPFQSKDPIDASCRIFGDYKTAVV